MPNDFRKTIIKPLSKKGDKSECGNYRGISLVSVGSKLLSNVILFRLRDAVDKVLREEQCGFGKGRGGVHQIFTLKLTIEKCLRCQTPLVLSFVDSVDRRALAKVPSVYGISNKYIIQIKLFVYYTNIIQIKTNTLYTRMTLLRSR